MTFWRRATPPREATPHPVLVEQPVPHELGAAPHGQEEIGKDGEPRRTPLRPLAQILWARNEGQNPDGIAQANLTKRNAAIADRSRTRAQGRLFMLGIGFFCAFSMIGLRMGHLAASDPVAPRASFSGANIDSTRADIVDRHGRLLATNLPTHSLYAQPHHMIEPEKAAAALAEIFPDLNAAKLKEQFTGARKFVWIKRTLSPEQMQAVHDIGEPGLLFGPREMRLYPNGALAAHILGGTSFGAEGVHSAEVIGIAGIEKALDARLRDPAQAGDPLRLSLDLTVQSTFEQVLHGGMVLMNAKGAAGVLMDAHTGEIVAMASLPDFDPNDRPAVLTSGDASDSPLFNRAVQGLYELGSTFKPFAAAQALELGLVNAQTPIDTTSPLVWGKFKIRDFRNYGPSLSLTDVIVKSSNTGTARLARDIGGVRQRAFLDALGLLDPVPIELVEAGSARPQFAERWSEIHTFTISYGHGISSSPLHLAAAYAPLVNGGHKVTPTLVQRSRAAPIPAGAQVLRPEVSRAVTDMMAQVVERGTARFAQVEGYPVAGKTGTAEKPLSRGGGYHEDKVIASFAAGFPADDVRYVLVVALDEPVETSGEEPRRTAGWTAVPVAAEIVRRTAPLMGLLPAIDVEAPPGLIRTSN